MMQNHCCSEAGFPTQDAFFNAKLTDNQTFFVVFVFVFFNFSSKTMLLC